MVAGSVTKGYDSKKINADPKKCLPTHAAQGNGERNEKPEYCKFEDRSEDTKGTGDLRNKAGDLKDRATTASGQKGIKDLVNIVSQVGTNSVALPNAYKMMGMASSVLAGMTGGGGSSGAKTPSSSVKNIIEQAFAGALAILIKQWSYDKTINVFDIALEGDNINKIDEEYRQIVLDTLENSKSLAIEYGPDNIPVYTFYEVTFIGPEPSGTIVTEVPDMYTKEYYLPDNDPYPGYIKWNSADETEYVFTLRQIGDKYFVSPEEEVYSKAEEELAEDLSPYIEEENLTAEILNDILLKQNENVPDNLAEQAMGKGAGGQLAQQLLQQLLGHIASSTNKQKSTQLPPSVLNQSSINESLRKYEKRQAEVKKMRKHLDKAFDKNSFENFSTTV